MTLKKILDEARAGLIDLSLKNPLLNYKKTKKRGIQITLKNPELFIKNISLEAKDINLLDSKLFEIDLEGDEILSRCKYTQSEARQFIEEKGANVLFFTLGSITWVEDERGSSENISPLLLIPIKIKIDKDNIIIEKLDDDIQENFALIEKLKNIGIDIPSLKDQNNIINYISDFNAIENNNKIIHNIEINKCTIDIFKTQKYFLYEDLNINNWDEELGGKVDLPIFISKLIENQLFSEKSEFNEDDIENINENNDPLLIKDADITQLKTLLNTRNGLNNFIIQGPPGTGKSQTITNLIADLVYRKKKILFVSEKNTALNVVIENFKEVGLESILLDLHDPESRKSSVLKDLEKTISESQFKKENSNFSIQDYYEVKNELQKIRVSLKNTVENSNLKIENILINLQKSYVKFEENKISFSKLDEILKGVEETLVYEEFIANLDILNRIETLDNETLFGSSGFRDFLSIHSSDHLDSIRAFDIVNRITKNINEYEKIDIVEVEKDNYIESLKEYVATNGIKNLQIIFDFIKLRNNELFPSKLFSSIKLIENEKNSYANNVKDISWGTPVNQIKKEIENASSGILELFGVNKKDGTYLDKYFNNINSKKRAIELIRVIESYQNKIKLINKEIKGQKNLEESSLVQVLQLIRTIILAVNELKAADLFEKIIEKSDKDLDVIFDKFKNNSENNKTLTIFEDIKELENVLKIKGVTTLTKIQFIEFIKYVPNIINKNREWNELSNLKRFAINNKLDIFLKQNICSPSEAFKYHYYSNLKRKYDSSNDYINVKNGNEIELLRIKFSELDKKRKVYSKELILLNQYENIKEIINSPTDNFILLNKLFKKTRNLPSIRNLIINCFDEIGAIKQVMMMSPLSVASFIPRKLQFFDYVIFDEASQIKPSDALGSLLRAKNAIIVGDSMQLPPTRMFDTESNDDDATYDIFDLDSEELDKNSFKDIESILDYASTLRMHEQELNWHYRSKFENLISVSNSEFYSSRLITFPDSKKPKKGEGLEFFYVENGNYERSTTRKNTNEAEIVVEEIINHLMNNISKSLGIATFSIAQKDAIEERLYQNEENRQLIQQHDVIHFNEKFFIKNLERIQGDERDCIFISIGYGKAVNSASNSINFGPLSQKGGERRLNVLISRAKYQCKVFSSIHYYDINSSNGQNSGVEKLKIFLKYAETKEIDLAKLTGNDYDSEFERDVSDSLSKLGYVIENQIASSGFKIDLAVKNPNRIDDYLCGIECDGATYHSSLTARERDRIRQEILENRGWKILRIWSTDWFRNKKQEIHKIDLKIKELLKE